MDFPVLTLGLGSSRRPKASNWSASTRPMQVENLEERITPDGGKYVSPKLSYTVSQQADSNVLIQGRVTGTYNANSTVAFSGSVSESLTTDAYGYFTVNSGSTAGAYLGTLSATAWDTHGTQTSTVSALLSSLPPTVLSFTVTDLGDNTWRLSGTVLNESLAGNTVTFGGASALEGITTTTDQDGNFSVDVQGTGIFLQVVTVNVSDGWGLEGSSTALAL